MSYRGYRGGRGGRGDDGGYRGRGGGYNSQKFSQSFDRRSSHFSKGDRFKGDRGSDFRKSYQDDYHDDGGFRGSSPKRFRGDSYGGDRVRSFKDFSSRSDSFDRGSRSEYSGRKIRGGRGFRGGSMRGSRGSSGIRRGGGGFTTKSGFVTKWRDYPRKYSGGSSRREYIGRLKPVRSRSRRDEDDDDDDDDDDLDDKHKSDDEIRDDDDELGDEEEIIEEEIEEEEEVGIEDEEEEDMADEHLDEDLQEEVKQDKEEDLESKELKKSSEKTKVGLPSARKKTTVDSDKKEKESVKESGDDEAEEQNGKKSSEAVASKSPEESKKKLIKKKVIIKKIIKKPSTKLSEIKDKDKESDKGKEKKEKEVWSDKEGESSEGGVSFTCPHCQFASNHVRVYQTHLKSKSHLLAMNRLSAKSRTRVHSIRIAQRKKQVALDLEARYLKLKTFICNICKLNYRTLKIDHIRSSSHRLLKRILLPECRLCNIRFKTSMMYDAHTCEVTHLRRLAKAGPEALASLPKDDELDELEEEPEELDPSSFMVLDAVEGEDDDGDGEGDGEDKSVESQSSKLKQHGIGKEFCKKVEVYYCKLCDVYLTKHMPGVAEETLTVHCHGSRHLKSYLRHKAKMNRRKQEESEIKSKKAEKLKGENGGPGNKKKDTGKEVKGEKEGDNIDEEEEEEKDEDDKEIEEEEEEELPHEEDKEEEEMEGEGGEEVGDMDDMEEEEEDGNWADDDLTDLLGEAEQEMATGNPDDETEDKARFDRFSKSNGKEETPATKSKVKSKTTAKAS